MSQTIIHIGYPKTGTTFLQRYFLQHPDVYYDILAFKKYREKGIFTSEQLINKKNKPFHVLSEEQLSGGIVINDKSLTDYGIKDHQSKVAKNLSLMFPSAKILITVRGFKSLIPSLYSQYISVGGIMNWNEFINSDHTVFTQFYDYDFLITQYYSYFGEQNVLVLPYELLQQDSDLFLKKIEHFFNLSHYEISNEVVNKSISNENIPKFIRMSKIISTSLKIMPKRTRNFIYNKYGWFLYHQKEKRNKHSIQKQNADIDLNKVLLPLKDSTKNLIQLEEIKPYASHYIIK